LNGLQKVNTPFTNIDKGVSLMTFKKISSRIKKIKAFISVLIAFAVFVAFDFIPFEERKVYTELIRLHILANSQSDEDISIKYEVRDEILKESENIFGNFTNSEDAKESMLETGKAIEIAANKFLERKGVHYQAKAVWGRETYPEREYEGISLPSGEYYSLRIVLGEGEGENWWCVLFPPLCLGASAAKEGMEDVGIGSDAFKTFSEDSVKYKIKFKLLEWLFG
jgi:stage II sporulation protein R